MIASPRKCPNPNYLVERKKPLYTVELALIYTSSIHIDANQSILNKIEKDSFYKPFSLNISIITAQVDCGKRIQA